MSWFAVLLILVYTLTVVYVFFLIFLTLGLGRFKKPKSDDHPFVSVIVAARNEEDNIPTLLSALTGQDYPAELFEIIIVDDASEDKTAEIVANYPSSENGPIIRLLKVSNRYNVISPKKNALACGIKDSAGELIMLTDADCVPPPGWISGMVPYFENDVGLVAGFSPYEYPRLLNIRDFLLALDSLSLAAVAAGSSGWEKPGTCNGRNLAYRKSVYEQLGGFKDIHQFVSGDDDLFLNLVSKKTDWKIRYAYEQRLVVPTILLTSFRQFYYQRIRHASKGMHYGWRMTLILAVLYLFNLLLFISMPLAFCFPSFWLVFLPALIIKSSAEFLFLGLFANHMNRFCYMRVFPLAVLLHIPYVVLFGLLGQILKFNWKNTSFTKKG